MSTRRYGADWQSRRAAGTDWKTIKAAQYQGIPLTKAQEKALDAKANAWGCWVCAIFYLMILPMVLGWLGFLSGR